MNFYLLSPDFIINTCFAKRARGSKTEKGEEVSCISGMALRKSRVRDFGGLVVRRFAYAKPVCVRDSRWREKSRRVRKSRTQNRVAYANRVRKSRT